jgi:hypothetical protein
VKEIKSIEPINCTDMDIAYVIQTYNRPYYVVNTLLSLRKQLIERQRPIYLIMDGPANESDKREQYLINIIFRTFFKDYDKAYLIQNDKHLGPERSFNRTFFTIFEDYQHENFCLLEDDLLLEHVYLNNVENLLECFYYDNNIACVNGVTRQTIYKSQDDLDNNKQTAIVSHNTLGTVYKKRTWNKVIKPIFELYRELDLFYKDEVLYYKYLEFRNYPGPHADHNDTIDHKILTQLNNTFKLNLPYIAYDKIVDHACALNKIFRISTYNRYLSHIGWFGYNNGNYKFIGQYHGDETLYKVFSDIIDDNWDYMSTDTTKLTKNFIFDKNLDVNLAQFDKF